MTFADRKKELILVNAVLGEEDLAKSTAFRLTNAHQGWWAGCLSIGAKERPRMAVEQAFIGPLAQLGEEDLAKSTAFRLTNAHQGWWAGCLSIGAKERPRMAVEQTFIGPLAQLVEQRTFNPLVIGSNPMRPTKYSRNCWYRWQICQY